MLRNALLMGLGAVVLLGCSGSNEPLTWEEFQETAYQEEDTGVYITNGDELAEDLVQLRAAYDRYRGQFEYDGVARTSQPLIVNRVNGQDDRWSATAAVNLTYCVSSSGKGGFGTNYSAVVNAMNSAAGAWEGTARVNFVHASAQDGNCNSRNNNVVFNVSRVCRGQYLARAFFPSSSRRGREILVDCTSFGNISPWTLTGVLRHELGHTIGFRHEHTRPESGVCFEDNNWRALTAYDSSSVMHYPQCNGTQTGDLVLTTLDRQGASILYP